MSQKATNKKDALLFIDTNIFLDFYSFDKEMSMKFLEEIKIHKDIIITTRQVEMEFKKNRQKRLLEAFSLMSNYNAGNYKILEVLGNSSEIKDKINGATKTITLELKKLPEKMKSLFADRANDIVFQTINLIFKNKSAYNLKEINDEIFNLSQKRFTLGFPPRKDSDTSIGDSINWEWIIKCGEISKKDIIIVSRDEDFGKKLFGQPYLNDFLFEEFQDRTGGKNKITITDKLTTAFTQVEIPVTQEMITEEDKIKSSPEFLDPLHFAELLNHIKKVENTTILNTLFSEKLSNYYNMSKYMGKMFPPAKDQDNE